MAHRLGNGHRFPTLGKCGIRRMNATSSYNKPREVYLLAQAARGAPNGILVPRFTGRVQKTWASFLTAISLSTIMIEAGLKRNHPATLLALAFSLGKRAYRLGAAHIRLVHSLGPDTAFQNDSQVIPKLLFFRGGNDCLPFIDGKKTSRIFVSAFWLILKHSLSECLADSPRPSKP